MFSDRNTPFAWLDEPRRFWSVFGAYLALQFLIRLSKGDAFELDEAQQFVWSQWLSPGYGSQPPLYTWLQILVFELLGRGVWQLVLLKYLVFSSVFVLCYLLALEMGLGRRRAALGVLLLLLLPQIGWEAQRDLTHSTLATALAFALLLTALRVVRKPNPGAYAMLGIVLGLGLLSKHVFWFFAAGVMVAAVRRQRELVRRPVVLIAPLLALLIGSPYLYWLYAYPEVALGGGSKLHGIEPWSWQTPLQGSLAYARAILDFCAVFLLLGLTWLRPRWHKGATAHEPSAGVALVGTAVAATVLLLYLFVLADGATAFKSRWLMPALACLPLLVLARCPADSPQGRRLKGLLASVALMAVLITLGIAGRYWAAPLTGAYTRPHFPGPAMAAEVERLAGTPALIIAENNRILAALKVHFPDTEVAYSDRVSGSEPAGKVLLAWDDEHSDAPSPALRELMNDWGRRQIPFKEHLLHLPLRLGTLPERNIHLRVYRFGDDSG